MKIYFVTKIFLLREIFCYEFLLTAKVTQVSITIFRSYLFPQGCSNGGYPSLLVEIKEFYKSHSLRYRLK